MSITWFNNCTRCVSAVENMFSVAKLGFPPFRRWTAPVAPSLSSELSGLQRQPLSVARLECLPLCCGKEIESDLKHLNCSLYELECGVDDVELCSQRLRHHVVIVFVSHLV